MIRLTLSLFVIAFAGAFTAGAQDLHNIPFQGDTIRFWRVETNDDNEFIGKIIGVEAGIMTLKTEKFGVITIRMGDIKTIEEASVSKMVDGSYWADNFQSTRYFFMPNGFGLKRGESYYQNVWVFLNQFNVGITDHFSVGVGMAPTFLLGSQSIPFWITPKLSIPVAKNVSIGAGLLYGNTFSFNESRGSAGSGFAVAYGAVTVGTRDKNASFGLGYGNNGQRSSRQPVFNFSTMHRLSARAYFLTENYLFISQGEIFGVVSAGGRRLIKKVGLDFGGFIPFGPELTNGFIIIPWLGVSTPLGKRYPAN